jgi:hypothetical protein
MIGIRNPSRPIKAVLSVATLLVFGSLIAGCDDHKGVGMSLSEAGARERINTYFIDTLRALPAEVGLSLKPENRDLGALSPGFAVPCNDRSGDTSGPVQVQIRYWVTGVPAGQTAHYFQLIRNVWTQRGYRPDPNPEPDWAAFRTSDGYGLVVQDAGKGDGSLSISAGSPCFPESAQGATSPQPTLIPHPA